MRECTYCGMPAWHMDHVVPRSHLRKLSEQKVIELRKAGELIEVPACVECNMLVGQRVFESLPRKRAWIQMELAKRYKDLLSNPETEHDRNNRIIVLMRLRWGGENHFDLDIGYSQLTRYLVAKARFENALRPHTSFVLNIHGHKDMAYGPIVK